MKDNIVTLTVVGIRNYCGGNAGLPEMFKRYPVGTELDLCFNTYGGKYTGAVRVCHMLNAIGTISTAERRFIELAIPKNGTLSCTVSGHSLEDKCMYVDAVNNVGVKYDDFREIETYTGETVIDYTEHDTTLEYAAKVLLSELKKEDPRIDKVLTLAKNYAKICCTSLDGENNFRCHDILVKLRSLNNEHKVFDEVIHEIYEKKKDLGNKNKVLMTQVYREQYERILRVASASTEGNNSFLHNYMKNLEFKEGGELNEEVISSEAKRLSRLLVSELENSYAQSVEKDEDFANQLYYLHYSLRATYILYTRRIKREYLTKYLDELHAQQQQGDKSEICDASGIEATPCSPDELSLPSILNTNRAQIYFKKAIDKGYIILENGKFSWKQIGNNGAKSQVAYFCGKVYEYEHSEYGNDGEYVFPGEELSELFGVKRLYSLLVQVHNAKKKQHWRKTIDELFE